MIWLYINSRNGINARGYKMPNGEFKILEGSTVSINSTQKSTPINAIKKRGKCEKEGIINNGMFVRDYVFNSISLAAEIVLGGSLNGNNVWKSK